jgi:uncharacterized protein YbjT (DUF2867 family)
MKRVLIAGASGFIGRALIERLLKTEDVEIVALSRGARESNHPRLIWKKCDLFSLKDITLAMEGCQKACYLVHSMLPSASLSQGKFYDFDLIMADNFVRAAKVNQLKHIVYLGGMIPEGEKLSWHLRSRLEVEETFRNSGIALTALRAGLVIGPGGSSFTILKRLIERLPIMICPDWTNNRSQPIALNDAINVLQRSLSDEKLLVGIFDIGGAEIITYQGLIAKTASKIFKKNKLITWNIIPLSISRFWVTLITRVPKNLVYPLVLSLKHEMLVQSEQAWPYPEDLSSSLDEALESSMVFQENLKSPFKGHEPAQRDVRSIQRLVLPEGANAEWVAKEYFKWLPSFFSTLVKVALEGNRCTFYLIHPWIQILILEKSNERSASDRQLLYVVGGKLSGPQGRGRLEFREVLDRRYVMAALHEFRPALPWYMYRWTQALVHLIVMKAFGEHLKWHIISAKKVKL